MRVSRKDKKILRAIYLCYSNNPQLRYTKFSKSKWVEIKNHFNAWLKSSFNNQKPANTVK